MMNNELVPNSGQMQQDLMTYQSWLKEQLQYTAFLQQNGPVAQYMKIQQQQHRQQQHHRQQQPHYSQNNGLQNRPYRGPQYPPGRGGNKQQRAGRPPQQQQQQQQQAKTRRHVATWTCYEPDGPPRTYFSLRPWKSQLQVSANCPEDQCSKIFRGRTLTSFLQHAPNALMPPDPQSRYCEDCGGLIISELRHKQSRLHREAVEMDVSLICSRIRRDPAFASAVIAAARECIENTGCEESEHDDDNNSTDEGGCVNVEGGEDDDGPPPSKQPRPSGSKAADEFEFLEGDVFRRAPLQKKAN
ncbi:hypothetical protein V5799_024487 [Amblyomma americanum]|uniref:Uncharacterized protein n=1 Tax=Amblyomma americanum TaxID=6943 RepID=A0AAQ4EC91_AMBAM